MIVEVHEPVGAKQPIRSPNDSPAPADETRMEIRLTERQGNSISGGRLIVRIVATLLMILGVCIEAWTFGNRHGSLLDRSVLAEGAVPIVLLGGALMLRWGLSAYEISHLPRLLRRFAH